MEARRGDHTPGFETMPFDCNLTRRELLKSAATATAGVAIAALAGTRAMAERSYGPFRIGIQSYSLRGYDFDTALAMTQKEDLHNWEAFQSHIGLTTDRAKIVDILAKFKAHHIRCIAWGVQGFDGNEKAARDAFEFGRMMGLETITADPSPESFPILEKLVEEYKINMAIHNPGQDAPFSTKAEVEVTNRHHHDGKGESLEND